MSVIIAQLNKTSADLEAESKALLAERVKLNELSADAAAREFEATEAQNVFTSLAGDRGGFGKFLAGDRVNLEAMNAEQKTQLAELLRPVGIANGKYAAAVRAHSAAADALAVKMKAHIAKLESHAEMQRKYIDRMEAEGVAELTREVDQIAGLLSFGLACGNLSEPESWRFCQDLIADFKEAKSSKDKRQAFSNVASCFAGLAKGRQPEAQQERARNVHLDTFNAMQDGPEKSAYYQKHRAEIISASAR